MFNHNKLIIEVDDEAGQIFLTASFDDILKLCFLDTGANISSIDYDSFFSTYSSHGLKSLQAIDGAKIETDFITIRKINLGSLFEITDVKLLRSSKNLNRPPTIGIDLFKNKVINFDFINKSYNQTLINEISNSGTIDSKTGFLLIEAILGNSSLASIWDTGAGLTSIDIKWVETNIDYFIEEGSIDVGNTIGTNQKAKLYRTKKIIIGRVTFLNVLILALDFNLIRNQFGSNINMIIGFNIISKANWKIDFNTGNWLVNGN